MKNQTNNQKAPNTLGLYIHIPFCRRKCLYCDFCSFPAPKAETVERYTAELCREIEERSAECKDHTVDTVYFGGGTPSLLPIALFSDIFRVLNKNYNISEDAEITVECNPLTHISDGEKYFGDMRRFGVNRLSIGTQSAVDTELRLIGRGHTFADAKKTFADARRAGFSNISLDLMFALPTQSCESLEYSLTALLSLSPEHISIYSLQLEEATPLFRMRNKYTFPNDDDAADMYEKIIAVTAENGYTHYEISNFAKDGYRSRHNTKYWHLDEYAGFGISAHSDFGGKRYENTSSLNDYLSGKRTVSESTPKRKERAEEYIMLGLRTKEGISAKELQTRYGMNFYNTYGRKAEKFKMENLIAFSDDRIFLTEKGFEVSNSILSDILDFDYQ